MTDEQQQTESAEKPIRKKWGEAINGGFVVIPSALFRHQHELKLDSTGVVVLANLLMTWWEADDLPFPRAATIAKRMGVTARTVQRQLAELERLGLVRRIMGRSTDPGDPTKRSLTRYDLSGIVGRLQKLGAATHPRRLAAQATTATPT